MITLVDTEKMLEVAVVQMPVPATNIEMIDLEPSTGFCSLLIYDSKHLRLLQVLCTISLLFFFLFYGQDLYCTVPCCI